MPSVIGTSGGNKTVAAMTVGTSGGNKAVLLGYVGTSGGNKAFFSALSASALPNVVSGSAGGSGAIGTTSTTATPSGGVGPFTYAWSVDNGAITIASPNAATTAFSANPVGPGTVIDGNATCVVTDTATGATAITNAVFVTVTRT